MFNTHQAHSLLVKIMQDRKARAGKTLKYCLHVTNRLGHVENTTLGYTVKELKEAFKRDGGAYRYAFITNRSGEKLHQAIDKSMSKKWVDYNRGNKK